MLVARAKIPVTAKVLSASAVEEALLGPALAVQS
jgi:hypothetical protein